MTASACLRRVAVLVSAALMAGCGISGTPFGTPSPKDILAKPEQARLDDAHFLVIGKFQDQGEAFDVTGDGAVVYKAPGAARFRLETTVAGRTVTFQNISVKGIDYTITTPGLAKWTARKSTSTLGPTSFSGASDYKYLGEQPLPGGKAWHVSARDRDGNPFDAWVRQSDGYPLRYRISQQGNALTLTFDQYNTGVTIAPPPPSLVVQG